jgi:hypothetical protein
VPSQAAPCHVERPGSSRCITTRRSLDLWVFSGSSKNRTSDSISVATSWSGQRCQGHRPLSSSVDSSTSAPSFHVAAQANFLIKASHTSASALHPGSISAGAVRHPGSIVHPPCRGGPGPSATSLLGPAHLSGIYAHLQPPARSRALDNFTFHSLFLASDIYFRFPLPFYCSASTLLELGFPRGSSASTRVNRPSLFSYISGPGFHSYTTALITRGRQPPFSGSTYRVTVSQRQDPSRTLVVSSLAASRILKGATAAGPIHSFLYITAELRNTLSYRSLKPTSCAPTLFFRSFLPLQPLSRRPTTPASGPSGPKTSPATPAIFPAAQTGNSAWRSKPPHPHQPCSSPKLTHQRHPASK